MDSSQVERKLTAILAADVVGYSRLMGDDHEATLATLTEYRQLFSSNIENHHGRVVNAPGDAILAEFASVVDGVACAVEIQRELAERNAELPEHRKMVFRIGINLGDVLVQEGGLYGDGVNIAARLEALAEPGGICISGTAFDQVETRLPLEYEYQGERTVKNIAKPVRVYRVLSTPGAAAHRVIRAKRLLTRAWRKGVIAAAAVVIVVAGAFAAWHFLAATTDSVSVEEAALEIPDRPSIAVLPFVNLSGDPEQEYFADGITETLITDLSQLRDLMVIARNSVFTYKGKPVDVRRVSRELGVRHVLEGSVQKVGDRVRISAQLIDATTGDHLWAQRFDRPLDDIFAVQDEITRKVVTELEVQLTEGEQARVWRDTTDKVEAYEYFLRGRERFIRIARDDIVQARQMLKKAIEADPDFVAAIAMLSATHYIDARLGWGDNPKLSLRMAADLAHQALKLDDFNAYAHAVLGRIYPLYGDFLRGLAEGRKAVQLNPSGAEVNAWLASTLTYSRKTDEGIGFIKKAMRLSPIYPVWYVGVLGRAYFLTGRYDEAINVLQKAKERDPEYLLLYVYLAATYSALDRMDDAYAEADNIRRMMPSFSLENWAVSGLPFEDPSDIDRIKKLLSKAGLK